MKGGESKRPRTNFLKIGAALAAIFVIGVLSSGAFGMARFVSSTTTTTDTSASSSDATTTDTTAAETTTVSDTTTDATTTTAPAEPPPTTTTSTSTPQVFNPKIASDFLALPAASR